MKTASLTVLAGMGTVALASVPLYGQCGGIGYAGDTTCASGSCCTYSNDYYSQCLSCSGGGGGGGGGATPTTTKASGGGGGGGSGSTPTGVTKTLPNHTGTVETSKPITVTGNFDGGMKLYDRSPRVCEEQTETGQADAMFLLEDGATISNVIIGPNQAEGIHCLGSCTINNVWFQDVCEDAMTFEQESGNSYVNGGGAFKADDKILQFNGFGTLHVKNFYAEDYGKVVRSCGNCDNNGGARHITIDGVVAVDGGVLCGINTNYGDTCSVTNSCQDDGKSCDRYTGNNDGDEPPKIGSGPDGKYCTVTNFSEDC